MLGRWFSPTKSICLWRWEGMEVLPGTMGCQEWEASVPAPRTPRCPGSSPERGTQEGPVEAPLPIPWGAADEEPQ